MRADSWRWTEVTPSQLAHERLGLEHVRDRLPDAAPYRAWSNFEFVATDGTPYEVDLLVLGPSGLHLVELKAWAGKITGDDHDWLEHNPGARRPIRRRNPLGLARAKAQRFRSWLERHPANTKRVRIPYAHESLLLHGVGVDCRLPEALKQRIYGMEDASGNGLRRIVTDHLGLVPGDGGVGEQWAKRLSDLITAVGLSSRPRETHVGEWVLDDAPYDSGWGWLDTLATHHAFTDRRARVRRWFVPSGASTRDAALVRSAAEREYRFLSDLAHPGLVAPRGFFEGDREVALVYPHDDSWVPLPTWLAQHESQLDVTERVALARQTAEVVRYAHDHGVVHRGLSPRSVLLDTAADPQRVLVKDWQAMGQADASTTTTATMHAHDLLERAGSGTDQVYAAPELATGDGGDRRRGDVFSLGSIGYRLITGREPAEDVTELRDRLLRDDGLDLAAVVDAPPEFLQVAVLDATRPTPAARTATSGKLIDDLDLALEELAEPDDSQTDVDPLDAQVGATLAGGLRVRRLLGSGGTSVALLVALPDGREVVLKAARDDERASRLDDEALALDSLDGSPLVAGLVEGPLTVGGRRCLLIEVAGERTLAEEIRADGRVSLDRLALWGRDLFEAVAAMERQGIVHRDIKPANLASRKRSADGRPHLVLFDFSLAGAPTRDITSGTRGYLDPFLGTPARRQYDQAAELFAVCVTLYELATGQLPMWGDGQTDPATIPDEVTVASDLLDPQAARGLTAFFRTALARDTDDRYGNVEETAVAWQRALDAAAQVVEVEPDQLAAAATVSTPLAQAGLSAKALSALERLDVATVGDLLAVDAAELTRLRGAAAPTRNEIVRRARDWRERLRAPEQTPRGLDAVMMRLLHGISATEADGRAVRALLGQPDLGSATGSLTWPTTNDVAGELDLARGDVSAAWRVFLERSPARREAAALHPDVVDALRALGDVASAQEVADRLISQRGSFAAQPLLVAQAVALVRLAVENTPAGSAAIGMRRSGDVVLLAVDGEGGTTTADQLVAAALPLGAVAERLARAEVLPSPDACARALQVQTEDTVLRSLPAPRLVSLAAAVTTTVTVSPRGELYARAMTAQRAVRFSRAALVTGGTALSEELVHRRVRARFPEASPLPRRPELDRLLVDAGTGLVWTGEGYGLTPATGQSVSRHSTWHSPGSSERIGDLLRSRVHEGDFLALSVAARMHDDAVPRLAHELEASHRDLTRAVLEGVRGTVTEVGADWDAVLHADRLPPSHPDRQLVDDLIRQTAAEVLERVAASERPVLVTDAAVLARHGCVDLLTPLAAFGGGRRSAVLLLVPQESSSSAPTLDGSALPLASPNQWVSLSEQWIYAGAPAGDDEREPT